MGEFEEVLKNCKKRGVLIYPPKPKKFSDIKTLFFAWDFAVKRENLDFVENLVKATFPKGYKVSFTFFWETKRNKKVQRLQNVKFTSKGA